MRRITLASDPRDHSDYTKSRVWRVIFCSISKIFIPVEAYFLRAFSELTQRPTQPDTMSCRPKLKHKILRGSDPGFEQDLCFRKEFPWERPEKGSL